MYKKIQGAVTQSLSIVQPVLQKMQYSNFSSFEVMHKTPNSGFGGSVALKLHKKALNIEYHRAFI